MTNIGIWIDKRKAIVVNLKLPETRIKTINSKIEESQAKSTIRGRTATGPAMTVKEKSFLERNKHQYAEFFHEIINEIKDVNNLYIMGPADAKNKLHDFIEKQTTFSPRIIQIAPADTMTDNQIVARVKQVFKDFGDGKKQK